MARKSRKNAETSSSTVSGMKIWRAGLYIRLSVERNGGRGDSLETQQQIMEAHLALYPDIETVKIYTDNGISGQTFERPAFQQMLADIEAEKIDCVVVKDLSRLGRNAIDTGYYVEKYFSLHNVRFVSINDQYDSEAADNDGSYLSLPLRNIANEAYAADISRKVRSQQNQAMRAGEFIGSRPPYGYRKDPSNCHRLLVNEDTAPVVRQIFQWAAEGTALNAIVKQLNETNVMTPSRYLASIGLIHDKRLMGSGSWQTWTVRKILENEVYLGDMVQGKTRSDRRKQSPAKPEEWIVVRNTHESLVSRELFAQAQAVRAQAANKYTQTEKVPFTPNIFKGHIFCAHCGRPLHRQRGSIGYFFRCIANDRIGAGACPGDIRVLSEDKLISAVLTVIQKQAAVIIGNGYRLKQSGSAEEQSAALEKEMSKLHREAEYSRKYLITLYEHFITGVLTKTEYIGLKTGYEQKINAATVRSQQLSEQRKELNTQLTSYIELSDWLAALGSNISLTSMLMDRLVDRIAVHDVQNISVYFKFKDEFESEIQK